MASEFYIDPEELRRAAGTITEAIEKIEGAVRNAEGYIKGSSQYWEGIAAERHQTAWELIAEQFYKVLEKLKEHPAELLETAGETAEAIQEASARVTALPTDVIN